MTDYPMHRCAWCGSIDTYFKYYRCWEEDELGNNIEVNSLDTEYTPAEEVWWCEDCEDMFAVQVNDEEWNT